MINYYSRRISAKTAIIISIIAAVFLVAGVIIFVSADNSNKDIKITPENNNAYYVRPNTDAQENQANPKNGTNTTTTAAG